MDAVMGDRLTLETADERELWRAVCSVVDRGVDEDQHNTADQAVRAYRERLPEVRDDGPSIDVVRVLMSLADEMESECDSYDVWAARVRGCAVSLNERGPTEGASDAVNVEALRQIVRELQVWADGMAPRQPLVAASLRSNARRILATIAERPPAGEASPEAQDAIDRARHSMLTARAERDEAQAKLGALIGAVEAHNYELRDHAEGGCAMSVATMDGERERLHAAVDAAKGDAPTECECGPGARFDEDAQVCRECRRPLGEDAPTATSSPPTPAPQVPDSPAVQHAVITHIGETPVMPNAPGQWWVWSINVYNDEGEKDYGWLAVGVEQTPTGLAFVDSSGRRRQDFAHYSWGGRCTRDAPDADLLALLGQAADELDRHDSNYHADSREFVNRLRTAIAAAKGHA